MPVSWFFAPYERREPFRLGGPPRRVCTMDEFSEQITDDGGAWSEAEVLGNQAIVKVNATAATLQAIAADARFARFPAVLRLLDDPLSSLNATQRDVVRAKVQSLGYSLAEINQRFPNLANATLGDVLRFVCKRRLKARYDAETDQIVLDGPDQVCKTPEAVDAEV